MMLRWHAATLLLAAAAAPAARAQGSYRTGPEVPPPAASAADEPPPLPPEPAAPPPPGPPATPNKAIDRYQDCLQRMIDAGANDNLFMRRCLGYPDRPTPKRPSEAEDVARDLGNVARLHLPALKDCYDKLLARSKDLGLAPEGAVDVRLELAPAGGVSALAFDATSLADVGLLSCFRERIKTWTLPHPRAAASGKLNVRLSLRLSKGKAGQANIVSIAKGYPKVAGGAASAGPGTAAAAVGGGGGGAAGLAPDLIKAVFMRNIAGVRGCYDELLRHHPGSGGSVVVELTVQPDGRVGKVAYRSFSVADPWFKTCVTEQLKSWRYPKPGEATVVRYPPLVFSPTTPPGAAAPAGAAEPPPAPQ